MHSTQKPEHSYRLITLFCEIALILAILYTGCATAFVVYSITAPPVSSPNSLGPIDVIFEIHTISGLLNVILPGSLLALGLWIWSRTRSCKIDWLMLTSFIAGLVASFTCAFAIWGGLVAMHEGAELWNEIWWR